MREYRIHECQCGGPQCDGSTYIVVEKTELDGNAQYDDVSEPCLSIREAEAIVVELLRVETDEAEHDE